MSEPSVAVVSAANGYLGLPKLVPAPTDPPVAQYPNATHCREFSVSPKAGLVSYWA